jgi:hypothetical protein
MQLANFFNAFSGVACSHKVVISWVWLQRIVGSDSWT